jgi:tetratricopeptide (TPR) repeat protein
MYDAMEFSRGGRSRPAKLGMRLTALAALTLALGLGLTGCSGRSEEDYLSEAGAMLQEQNLLRATILYKEFLDKYPESPNRITAQLGLAEAYYRNRDYDLCRGTLDEIMDQSGGPASPVGFQAFLTKLRTYNEEERFDEGLAVAEATSDTLATAPLPMKQAFQMFLGDFYARTQRPQDAIAMYDAILAIEPPTMEEEVFHLQLLNKSASLYESEGRLADAMEMFRGYIEAHPNVGTRSQIQQSMGRIEAWQGNEEAAERHYADAEADLRNLLEASDNEENRIRYRIGLANLDYLRGRNEAADAELRKIIDENTESSSRAVAMNLLASRLAEAGDYETAMSLLQQVVTTYPNTAEAGQAISQARVIYAIRTRDADTTATPETVTESLPLSEDATDSPASDEEADETVEEAPAPDDETSAELP